MFSPLGRVGLNGPGGLFSFSFLADVVMTEKNTKRTKFEKNLTLLDSINPEVFLGIFVSIFNFFEFKFKLFESGRYVPVQTGTGAHRYHRYSRYTGRFAPVRRTLTNSFFLGHDGPQTAAANSKQNFTDQPSHGVRHCKCNATSDPRYFEI
jgi:hypothetical protein